MKRYDIPFDKIGNKIEDIIWKFPFSEDIADIRKKSVNGEKIYEIELCPDVIDRFLNMPHMVVIINQALRKNLLDKEKIFPNYYNARTEYEKVGLNMSIADIRTVWKVNELAKHAKITLYEIKI